MVLGCLLHLGFVARTEPACGFDWESVLPACMWSVFHVRFSRVMHVSGHELSIIIMLLLHRLD